MKKLLLLIVPLLLGVVVCAQDFTRSKPWVYKIVVTTINPDASTHGYLVSISDSSVFVSSNAAYAAGDAGEKRVSEIDYTNINTINFRRQGATGRGILVGSIAGLSAGLIAGVMGYEEPEDNVGRAINAGFGIDQGTTVVAGGVVGVLSGGIVGGVIGALAKRKFIIGGSRDKFQKMKSKIVLQ